MRLVALGVGAVLAVGLAAPRQDPTSQLRFHHLHFRADDPAAAMASVISRSGGTRVILQGLGVGVRLADQYVLFDRMSGGSPPAGGAVTRRVEVEYGEVSRWLKTRGFNVAPSDVRVATAAVTADAILDHIAFATPDLEGTIARLRERGDEPTRKTTESAMVMADGVAFEIVHDTDRADAFWCPMHPDVRSPSVTRCPICSMDLVPIPAPAFGHYRLDVTQVPRPDGNGVRALTLTIRHPQTDAPVAGFTEIHERLLHLFVVRRDLTLFAHVHPERAGDGFEVPIDLPPGAYVLIADFVPSGGAPQLVQHAIVTQGYSGSPFERATVAADLAEKVVDGLRVGVRADGLRAGKETVLRFTIRDAASGAVVTDLEPYLGAAGHLLVVSADLTQAIHAHPEGVAATPVQDGDVVFAPVLPAPGPYKLWVQVQRQGKVVTVPFAVVAR